VKQSSLKGQSVFCGPGVLDENLWYHTIAVSGLDVRVSTQRNSMNRCRWSGSTVTEQSKASSAQVYEIRMSAKFMFKLVNYLRVGVSTTLVSSLAAWHSLLMPSLKFKRTIAPTVFLWRDLSQRSIIIAISRIRSPLNKMGLGGVITLQCM